jgi:thiosulfate/3-mercaptopyruvate sulfurtransferase
MRRQQPAHHSDRFPRALILVFCLPVIFVFVVDILCARPAATPSASTEAGWAASQLVAPETMAKELTRPKSQEPRVVCVGFEVLFRGAHIPGARYAGPARQASGLAELKRWAASVPRQTPIVIYCGCCPMSECPNIRPAFAFLRREGFVHVRVLYLPNSFAKDWVEKGYPRRHEAND